jgi:hypothetical protein
MVIFRGLFLLLRAIDITFRNFGPLTASFSLTLLVVLRPMRMIIFINYSEHSAIIASVVPLFHKFLFLLHDTAHRGFLIFLLYDPFKGRGNVIMLVIENLRLPLGPSNCIPSAVCVGSVNEF